MKLLFYNASARPSGFQTGVGKHAKRIIAGLNADPDVTARFMVPADYWVEDQRIPQSSVLSSLGSFRYPAKRLTLDVINSTSNLMSLEGLEDNYDWVYSPREQYLKTGSTGYAITFHDLYLCDPLFNPEISWRSKARIAIWKKAAREADIVFTVSEFSKGRIQKLFGISGSKIVVVGNGIDDVFFEAGCGVEDKYSCQSVSNRYFLSVGSISGKKGGEHLLRFSESLWSIDRHIKLVVIGPVLPKFRAEVRKCRNLEVMSRGVSDVALADLMARATGFVMLSNYEGFGIPALEAMASGTPVIVSNRAALPEIVSDAGMVVEPTSDNALKESIANCLDDDTRDKFIAKGFDHASKFTWDHCISRVKTTFENN